VGQTTDEDTFVHNGVAYFATSAPHDDCEGCAILDECRSVALCSTVSCSPLIRKDKRNVIFLTLEDLAVYKFTGKVPS
jgi:hypothetical protein